MSGSTIAIIYGAVIVLFFILLVVLTITLIVSKGKGEDEESEEVVKEYTSSTKKKKKYDYSNYEDEDSELSKHTHNIDKPVDKSDSIFSEADSAFVNTSVADSASIDSAFSDSAFSDSAFSDSAFSDSAFSDSVLANSAFNNIAEETQASTSDIDVSTEENSEEGADVTTIDLKLDANYDAIASAQIPEENSTFTSEEPVEVPVEDSAFAPEVPVEDSAFAPEMPVEVPVEDSAFASEMPVEAPVEDSAFAPEMPVEVPVEDSVFAPEAPAEDSAFASEAPAEDSAFASDSAFSDSAFGVPQITEDAIDQSVKEAIALSAAMTQPIPPLPIEPVTHASHSGHSKHRKSPVPVTDDFYWYNKMDVADKPSYKTVEMYYHHFNLPKDCIEDLIMEMYDCALVRTEEIKYIAYGIEPRAVSMREILTSGNRNYTTQAKLKEPTTQDLVRIYEKWCGYVDKLFEKIEIHADDYTISEIRRLLCEFGRSDVDVLIEGM